MRHYAGAMLLGLWALAAGVQGAQAQTGGSQPVVVELFTSQGCSSCPPADALLAELAKRADVLPLALHVDYWDYIGWVDQFAQPGFAKRQKSYAHAAGRRMIYTPQMIVDGHLEVAGYDPTKVLAAIQTERDRPRVVQIDILHDAEGAARVRLIPTGPIGSEARVVLVRFIPVARADITRGENAGQSMVHTNVVTDWTVLGIWKGTEAVEFALPAPVEPRTPSRAAVLVQQEAYGPILSAARLD